MIYAARRVEFRFENSLMFLLKALLKALALSGLLVVGGCSRVPAYPQSPRAAEVSAALGWLLLRTGQMDDAERAFREAGRDRSPQVSESIRAGLAAVAQARARGGL